MLLDIPLLTWALEVAELEKIRELRANNRNQKTPSRSEEAMKISISICTRNRAEFLRRALSSISEANPLADELLIVDQSDEFLPLDSPWPRPFRHLPTKTRGLARARNEALRSTTCDVVFFTDDDCLLQAGTVELVAEMFAAEPDLGLAFGAVRANAAETQQGFIPTYSPPRREVLRGRANKRRDRGIGACMAVRRDIGLAIGGFDERFGAGARLSSGEDSEFAYRVLKYGYALGHLPEAWVEHEGLKAWDGWGRLMREVYRAIGAAYAVHLRQGDLVPASLLMDETARVLLDGTSNLLHGKSLGITRLEGLFVGIFDGLRMGGLSDCR